MLNLLHKRRRYKLAVLTVQSAVLWDVTPWSLVAGVSRLPGLTGCLHYRERPTLTPGSSGTSTNICQTTRRHIPERTRPYLQ